MLVNAVIRWCLKNPFVVLVASVAALVWAWYALQNTPVDAIPDIGEKQVIVVADWPGRSAPGRGRSGHVSAAPWR